MSLSVFRSDPLWRAMLVLALLFLLLMMAGAPFAFAFSSIQRNNSRTRTTTTAFHPLLQPNNDRWKALRQRIRTRGIGLQEDVGISTGIMLGNEDNGPCDRRHHGISSSIAISTRSRFLASLTGTAVTLATTLTTATTSMIPSSYCYAFEGGIGGLGKTKPQTGVVFWDSEFTPLLQQNEQGVVTAELNVGGLPVLVTFQTPWPLLASSSGLEARDLQNSESAFVSVIENENSNSNNPETKQGMRQLLLESVLSPQGKFGAYGDPMDVKVKQLVTTTTSSPSSSSTVVECQVTFTTLTPGLRESERQMLVKAIRPQPLLDKSNNKNQNWILLVVGTTRQRFAVQQDKLQTVLDSFEAVAAPASSRSR